MSRVARFSLSPPHASEVDIHTGVAALLDHVLLPPAEWTTFPAGGYGLTPQASSRLMRMGLKPAWPDILIVHDRRCYGIELKTEVGRLSITRTVRNRRGGPRTIVGQREMHPRLNAAGMEIAVCRSIDDVMGWMILWGMPTRLPFVRTPTVVTALPGGNPA